MCVFGCHSVLLHDVALHCSKSGDRFKFVVGQTCVFLVGASVFIVPTQCCCWSSSPTAFAWVTCSHGDISCPKDQPVVEGLFSVCFTVRFEFGFCALLCKYSSILSYPESVSLLSHAHICTYTMCYTPCLCWTSPDHLHVTRLCLCSTFKHDVSSNARAMLKLMNGADMAKHSLSSLGSANCFVDSLHDGIDFECNVSR